MKSMKKAAVVIAATGMALGASTGVAFAGGHDGSGATAEGAAIGSPGVLSGNNIQIPISIPINICGNSVNVIAALNPAAGNVCVNR
ncbi:MAG TPA: chaplin [Streptomyces sp.]|nr:chaplin [Streptomyces sp.]